MCNSKYLTTQVKAEFLKMEKIHSTHSQLCKKEENMTVRQKNQFDHHHWAKSPEPLGTLYGHLYN